MSVLYPVDVRLSAASAMPFRLFQVRADYLQVEAARQGPLFEAAAAFQQVQHATFEPRK
jgi:hypothetical protein